MVRRWFWVILLVPLIFMAAPYLSSPSSIDGENAYYHALTHTVRLIYSTQYKNIFGEAREDRGAASGILIANNRILTCYHLMEDYAPGALTVYQFTGKTTETRKEFKIIKADKAKDLLLLEITPPLPGAFISLAQSTPGVGDDIFFTGHTALTTTRLRFARFLINNSGIMLFPVYNGDSGGGVFNTRGELIGIIHIVLQVREDNILHPTLIGYAIPLSTLREFLNG